MSQGLFYTPPQCHSTIIVASLYYYMFMAYYMTFEEYSYNKRIFIEAIILLLYFY